ncbi:MAG: hypothetical protein QOH98_238 [Methylobacteriaceae bacterium]|jgi:hypothetical protein|nr:hypothetical protein [Methylobacteriaceae bacterium]
MLLGRQGLALAALKQESGKSKLNGRVSPAVADHA